MKKIVLGMYVISSIVALHGMDTPSSLSSLSENGFVDYSMYEKEEPSYEIQEGDRMVTYPGYKYIDLPDEHADEFFDDEDARCRKNGRDLMTFRKLLHQGEAKFRKDFVDELEPFVLATSVCNQVHTYKRKRLLLLSKRSAQKWDKIRVLCSRKKASGEKITEKDFNNWKKYLLKQESAFAQTRQVFDEKCLDEIVQGIVVDYMKEKDQGVYDVVATHMSFEEYAHVAGIALDAKYVQVLKEFIWYYVAADIKLINCNLTKCGQKLVELCRAHNYEVDAYFSKYQQDLMKRIYMDLARNHDEQILDEEFEKRVDAWALCIITLSEKYPKIDFSNFDYVIQKYAQAGV